MTFDPADLYHSGFLVEDLEATMALLGAAGLARWTRPREHELRIEVDGRPQVARFRYVYSADGPHHVELIQPLEGAYLQATGPMTFHHFGFWVDDLGAPDEDGLRLECTFLDTDGEPKVSYHVDSAGLRYERVPRSRRADMTQRWARARDESRDK